MKKGLILLTSIFAICFLFAACAQNKETEADKKAKEDKRDREKLARETLESNSHFYFGTSQWRFANIALDFALEVPTTNGCLVVSEVATQVITKTKTFRIDLFRCPFDSHFGMLTDADKAQNNYEITGKWNLIVSWSGDGDKPELNTLTQVQLKTEKDEALELTFSKPKKVMLPFFAGSVLQATDLSLANLGQRKVKVCEDESDNKCWQYLNDFNLTLENRYLQSKGDAKTQRKELNSILILGKMTVDANKKNTIRMLAPRDGQTRPLILLSNLIEDTSSKKGSLLKNETLILIHSKDGFRTDNTCLNPSGEFWIEKEKISRTTQKSTLPKSKSSSKSLIDNENKEYFLWPCQVSETL